MQDVIIRPILTEKSLQAVAKGFFTFAVKITANKNNIAKAVADTYKVHVRDVRTIRMPGKARRVGKKMFTIQKPDWKKTIVLLAKGETIDAFQITGSDSAAK